ncbi:MAG: hypothetical protein ACXVPK_13340 [Tumebacillaceae bacterium]
MKKTTKVLLTVAATLTLSTMGSFSVAHAGDTSSTAGVWSGYPNTLNLAPSLKGDFLFGYNNGCMYSVFSHTALASQASYVASGGWDGLIIESTNSGTPSGANSVYTNHWQSHFHNYDAASLGYFSKSGYSYSADNVVNTASHYTGSYSVTSSFSDNSKWYCSKLVSRATYDNNGYNLGFVFWGSFIAPGDIWYDSAVYVRSNAISSHYDGGSVFAASGAAPLATAAVDPSVSTFDYHGVKVQGKSLDKETMRVADTRIAAEKAAGKSGASLELSAPDAKPGLKAYVKDLIKQGKATKEQVKAKWGLTDADL